MAKSKSKLPKVDSLVRTKKELFLLPNDKLTVILRGDGEDLLSVHGFSKVFARVTFEVFDSEYVASLFKTMQK